MIKIRNCFWSEKSAYSYPNLFFFFFFRVFPHTFFDYFFQHSNLYKERSHLIIQHTFHPLERKISFFLRSERHMFLTLKPHIFSDPLSDCCYKIRVFRFQRELNKFLWILKHSLKNKMCSCKRLFPSALSCDVMMLIISLSFSNIYELLIVLLFKAWYFLYDCYNHFLECQ